MSFYFHHNQIMEISIHLVAMFIFIFAISLLTNSVHEVLNVSLLVTTLSIRFIGALISLHGKFTPLDMLSSKKIFFLFWNKNI